MANFKRKGPKSTRAGCLLCKPQKRQGSKLSERQRHSQTRWIRAGKREITEVLGPQAGRDG